jgi:hypothetical protein
MDMKNMVFILTNLIRDVRSDLNISQLPFIIGELGGTYCTVVLMHTSYSITSNVQTFTIL